MNDEFEKEKLEFEKQKLEFEKKKLEFDKKKDFPTWKALLISILVIAAFIGGYSLYSHFKTPLAVDKLKENAAGKKTYQRSELRGLLLNKEQHAAINMLGQPDNTWAGQVRAGFDYNKITYESDPDKLDPVCEIIIERLPQANGEFTPGWYIIDVIFKDEPLPTAQSAPSQEIRDVLLTTLSSLNGKHMNDNDVKLFNDGHFMLRLFKLVGNNGYYFIKQNWQTDAGIVVKNNIFNAEGFNGSNHFVNHCRYVKRLSTFLLFFTSFINSAFFL
jgi:hypothetical protein